jgi:hypothetical protein
LTLKSYPYLHFGKDARMSEYKEPAEAKSAAAAKK